MLRTADVTSVAIEVHQLGQDGNEPPRTPKVLSDLMDVGFFFFIIY